MAEWDLNQKINKILQPGSKKSGVKVVLPSEEAMLAAVIVDDLGNYTSTNHTWELRSALYILSFLVIHQNTPKVISENPWLS